MENIGWANNLEVEVLVGIETPNYYFSYKFRNLFWSIFISKYLIAYYLGKLVPLI